jgi:hypothetical protein
MKEIRKKLSHLQIHMRARTHAHTHKNKNRYTPKKLSPLAFVRNEEPLPMAMLTLMPPFHTWALHVSLRRLYLRGCNPPRPVPRPIFSLGSSPTSHITLKKNSVFKLCLDFSSFKSFPN